MKLRLAFMGTPDFAVPALQALLNAGHDVLAVYCQPPKPAGRGQQIQLMPVHKAAEEKGLGVRTPRTLKDETEQQFLRNLHLDAIVVVAYGLLLPKAVLETPKLGCFNIHGSLLPRWRGAAPIQRAMLAGDTSTGITIMQMDVGLDTGAMFLRDEIALTSETTASSLHDALANMGARLIIKTLEGVTTGLLQATPQPIDGATYAAKLTREEGVLDWKKSANFLDLQIRALTPWPGSFFTFNGENIKVLKAEIVENTQGKTGALLDNRFTIACGTNALRLLAVQRAGKKATDAEAVLRGMRLEIGHILS